MFKNYFKLAIKVLGRRKFFTFISLFGISFTLMILMLITAFLDNEMGSNAPLTEKDRMVFMPRVIMTLEVIDTVPQIDSTEIDGMMRYDTTYEYVNRRPSFSSSSGSYPFITKNLKNVDGTEYESVYSPNNTFDLFINSNKLTFGALYTDADYWNVFDFKLIEGRFYQDRAIENQEQVLVMTEKSANSYFGRSRNVIGEKIKIEDVQYEVIGVVATPKMNHSYVSADVYLPVTTINSKQLTTESFLGGFESVYLAKSTKTINRVKADIDRKVRQVTLPNPEDYNTLQVRAFTFMERYATSMMSDDDNPEKSIRLMLGALGGLLLLFILLPTLNLVNVNISRILERSSEIGVRKAFGAHSANILVQFVFENIILTFLGGLIGFILAYALLYVINDSQVLGDIYLTFNTKIFLYSLLICLVFGILSGIIPAYRMSKMHIANALKQNQL